MCVNGVPLDPGAGESFHLDRGSGWQYEALSGAVALGLDTNHGHVQPTVFRFTPVSDLGTMDPPLANWCPATGSNPAIDLTARTNLVAATMIPSRVTT